MLEITAQSSDLERKLNLICSELDNLTQYMIDASEASFHYQLLENFSNSGNRGNPWKDLAESTKKQKQKEGKVPYQILIDGGDLRQKWQTTAIRKNHVIFSTAVPYAIVHQYGTQHIPARPFLPNSEADLADYKAELSAALAKAGIPCKWS